jgi:flagellar biogenesis protein FliO
MRRSLSFVALAAAMPTVSAAVERPPESLPLRRDAGDEGWRQSATLAFIFIVVLAAGAFLLVRRVRRRGLGWSLPASAGLRQQAGPRVLHRQSLSAQASVQVVAWGDREWLLGVTAQHVQVLASRDADPASNDIGQANR